MPLTPAERAAHALRVKAPEIADGAVAALYRLRPGLDGRYGDSGRRHCARDLGYHLRFLAAAVEMSDARVFADYAAWAARVMVTHRVAPEDAMASFRCLLDVAPAAVPRESAGGVRDVIAGAVARVESNPPPARVSRRLGVPRPTHAHSN